MALRERGRARQHDEMRFVRPWKNFRADPSSLRYATMALISLSLVLVIVGAVLVRVFDAREYPTFGEAIWFTLQTVTTVGYGDNPPVSWVGRTVTSIVMLSSIGLITVITAIVTSLFIQSVSEDVRQADQDDNAASLARIEAALAATQERLDRLDQRLADENVADGPGA